MRRWGMLMGMLLAALISGVADAGGAGSIRLARPLDRVAAGEALLYLQALQHDVHPLDDAVVTVKGAGPPGTGFEVEAKLDPTFGENHVYQARLPLKMEGRWQLTVTADHWVRFPPLTFAVEVLPCGSEVAAPGPVKPVSGESAGHSHGAAASPAPAPAPAARTAPPAVRTVSLAGDAPLAAVGGPPIPAPETPRPALGDMVWLLGAGGALVSAGAGAVLGFCLARRRTARV